MKESPSLSYTRKKASRREELGGQGVTGGSVALLGARACCGGEFTDWVLQRADGNHPRFRSKLTNRYAVRAFSYDTVAASWT